MSFITMTLHLSILTTQQSACRQVKKRDRSFVLEIDFVAGGHGSCRCIQEFARNIGHCNKSVSVLSLMNLTSQIITVEEE